MQAAQDAMNEVWNVPRVDQPSFVSKRLLALGALLIIGAVLVVTATSGQLLAFLSRHDVVGRAATLALAVVVNTAAYLLAFQVLASKRHRWRVLVAGAVVGGAGYTALQAVGRWYVDRTVSGAEDTYGTFAVVIGLLGWLYLLAQLSLFAAEVNVVRELRLWPRSIRLETPTAADREVARATAEMARMRPDTFIDVRFDAEADSGSVARER
jgi:YihY family inner membrane protein